MITGGYEIRTWDLSQEDFYNITFVYDAEDEHFYKWDYDENQGAWGWTQATPPWDRFYVYINDVTYLVENGTFSEVNNIEEMLVDCSPSSSYG